MDPRALLFAILIMLMPTLSAQVRRMDVDDPTMVGNVQWKLCQDEVPHFDAPCLCAKTTQSIDLSADGVLTLNGSNADGNRYVFDCDGVSLPGNVPVLPLRLPVLGYSHRHGGFQTFPRQLFAASNVALRWADFGRNHLQRLSDRFLEGVEETLEELYLGHNSLGHQLNPIFATNAFNSLSRLRILDISYNMLRDLDDALFQGLDSLEELRLNGNQLGTVPSQKLQNLPKMTILNLQHNQIDKLNKHEFSILSKLEQLNMSNNVIAVIENDAFSGLDNLTHLDLSTNQIHTLENEEIFSGLISLRSLDLSNNFLSQVPSRALRSLSSLTNLMLASNGIRELRLDDFAEFSNLERVDLSRNRIAELPPTVFSRLTKLRQLLLDVNLVRKIEEPAFEGLRNLEHLSMNDNNVLGLPNGALASVPSLRRLDIGHNRIAAVSPDLLRTVRNLRHLDLQFNLVREVPDGTFENFTELTTLNLRGNHVRSLTANTFIGIEKTLLHLDLSGNGLETYPPFPQSLEALETLDLSHNRIVALPEDLFVTVPSIKRVNLGHNRLVELTPATFNPPQSTYLEELNLAANQLKIVPKDLFATLRLLNSLDLSGNQIREIEEGTFRNLPNLRSVDLSRNEINAVRPKAFGLEMQSMRLLNLSGNALTMLDGAIFETRISSMHSIDVSDNHIHYLIPNALSAVPRLEHLFLNGNRLTLFLEGLLGDVPYLTRLLLQNNHLHQIDGEQFSHARRLMHLDVSRNGIEMIGDRAFYNSSQVRRLNLSHNRLTTLPEGVFDGLARLQLNLNHNNLTALPVGIFARHRVANLQSIDLSANQFKRLPLSALNDQYATLEDLMAADNDVSHIPANANSLVNVKRLDLSNNPLNEESIQTIFGEPKTVQDLKLTGCGIADLPRLETPFLLALNLSNNGLTSLRAERFQRTTLLSTLDLSKNDIRNLSSELPAIWTTIAALRHLNLSENPLKDLGPRQLDSLKSLESLSLSNMQELGRFDDEALTGLKNLKHLSIHGYPRLGYYDVSGILEGVPSLESLDVEIKTNILRDQLHPAYNARLSTLILRGRSLQNLTSVSFAGLLASKMNIGIHGTNVVTIPNTIFLPLPNSADITLDLSDNRIAVLGPQLTMTLTEKRGQVRLVGLDESNPLYCDCNMKPMLAWIGERIADGDDHIWKKLKCLGPQELEMQSVWRLNDGDMTCERPTTTTTSLPPLQPPNVNSTTADAAVMAIPPPSTSSETPAPTDIFHVHSDDENVEPDIIYESPTPRQNPSDAELQSSLTNMDSMIIGIIVGVVAFICILIIIICIIKLRQSRMRYERSGPMMHLPHIHNNGIGGGGGGVGGPCTCVKPSPGGSYQNMPLHQGTLPRKFNGGAGSVKSLSRSIGHYNHPNGQPYYVTYSESDPVDFR